jgi:hypothetical protein
VELAGLLETVVYCTTENEDETRRFCREVLGLRPFAEHEDPAGNLLEIAEGDMWPP